MRPGPGLAQLVGLGLAPALGHGLGEIGEEHGEPEPEGDLEAEAERLARRPGRRARPWSATAPDLGDEHDGVLQQRDGD